MKVKYFARTIFLLSGLLLVFTMCEIKKIPMQENEKIIEIRGIYGSPTSFWKKGYRLDSLGVNAIFVHGRSITPEMIQRAKNEGALVFAEFATLNGKKYVDTHPEAWAINEQGEKVEPASWFMGVCPTEPDFRQYRFLQLREILKLDLDGIWMDYLHWHAQFEEPEPILPETCFCDHCLTSFQSATGIKIPDGSTADKAAWILKNRDSEWRNWRCSVIAGWVRDFRKIIDEIKPDALLGVYHCPWDDEEYNAARRRILGLDYDLLKEMVDVFSPMVYHGRMGRSPEWVGENIAWFCQRLNIKPEQSPKVWPIVQAYNDPSVISEREFEKVLRHGLSAGATGVMMFTSRSVADDETKTDIMKKVYMEHLKQN